MVFVIFCSFKGDAFCEISYRVITYKVYAAQIFQ